MGLALGQKLFWESAFFLSAMQGMVFPWLGTMMVMHRMAGPGNSSGDRQTDRQVDGWMESQASASWVLA